MENRDSARAPDSDTNWRAIDIFVFSNGQQYSPPRKYHLQAEDIDMWKSTLAFLAKTQYGPYHSTVELFTTRGRKVTNPLELCNGESYVAVQPPDCFINAGYEKYLLKASRSWEKRQAKKIESTLETEVNQNPATMTVTETKVIEDSSLKSKQISANLDKESSNVANQDPSAITKPQPTTGSQRNSIIAKQTERRKSSLQAPLFVRKLTPTLPTPNLRNPFKRGDIKSANNVKLSKPEVSRNSSSSSNYSAIGASKTVPKLKSIKPVGKGKDVSMRSGVVLPKLSEIINEVKAASISKLAVEKLSTINTDSKSITNDNALLVTSTEVYENPSKEMPSISINPYWKHSIVNEPVRQNANTTVIAQLSNINQGGITNINATLLEKNETPNKIDEQESIKINHSFISNSAAEKVLTEKADDQYKTSNIEANQNIGVNLNNTKMVLKDDEKDITKIVKDITKINDNSQKEKMYHTNLPPTDEFYIDSASEGIKRTVSKLLEPQVPFGGKSINQDLPPRKRSVSIEQPEQTEDVIGTSNVNPRETNCDKDVVLSTGKSNETLKMYSSSHRRTLITNDSFEEQQSIIQQETFSPPLADKLISDQYKATLRKGDVVNLKLNIQIERCESGSKRHDDNLKSQSVTFMQTEKESQNIIDEQLIVQNKSLLTLIGEELQEKQTGDNNKIIIVQCGNCKHCNNHNATTLDNDVQKSYIILLPMEKLQTPEKCHCGNGKQDNDDLRVKSIIKQSNSCNSLGKASKSPGEPDDNTRSIYIAPEPKSFENVVEIIRKKSVAINEEHRMAGREPTVTQEIDVKSELIEISVTSSTGTVAGGTKKDAAMQTDWCDVLLEAKLQPNGMYSFQLPSLELLKVYNLT